MPIVTHKQPVKVPISGTNFTWDEFARGLGEITKQQESLQKGPREESSRGRTGWVCKVHPDRFSDIKAWPAERQRWTQKQYAGQKSTEFDLIDIPHIQLSVSADATVAPLEMEWSYHWDGWL